MELCRQSDYKKQFLIQLKEALSLAKLYLEDKRRLSGTSVYDHVLEIAAILVDTKADPATILAGIAQEILPYHPVREIAAKLGEDVLRLAQGVTEIKALKLRGKDMEVEAMRKLMLATAKDVRIIIIKLASKLANLREITFLPPEKQKHVAEEVLDFYAPLAYRLGMEKIRAELENRAFAVVNPRKYEEIAKYLKLSEEERTRKIQETLKEIKELAKDITVIKIKGRPKHIYSIYRKITKRGVPLHEQYDLLGIRVIVPKVEDCYTLLGRLHEFYHPLEDKLKDYIANPKPNGYRSIHTTLQLSDERVVEVQIRTLEMDEFAEEGVAAHWRYKGMKGDEAVQRQMSWLKGVLELQQQTHEEFMETAKIDVFGDRIQCYTPRGDVKELPEGAAILDFAYLVHEEVGNQAVGAKVNGKFVPLKHVLKKGDVVEIVTSKNQRPRRSWLKIVKSSKTRQKIRKSLKEHEKLPAFFYRAPKPGMNEDQGVLVGSSEFPNALCILAKCCLPLPGDRVVGMPTKRRVISVHKDTCREALKEEKRWVQVHWKTYFNQKIRFFVVAEERSGLLADVLHTIARAGFEVKEAKAKMAGKDVECSFLVVPRDLEQVQVMMGRVQKVRGIKRMYFE